MVLSGRAFGEEFVYPKAQAIELAKSSSTPVLEMPETVKVEAARPEELRVVAELERTSRDATHHFERYDAKAGNLPQGSLISFHVALDGFGLSTGESLVRIEQGG